MSDLFLDPPPWPVIIALTLLACVLFMGAAVLVALVPPRRTPMPQFVKDLLERAIKTFLQTFLGALVASSTIDLDNGKKALLAGVAAALSVVSSLISSRFGARGTASLLPPPPPPAG